MSKTRHKSVRPVRILSLFSTVVTTLLFGCAEVAPPPGGEVDRAGPVLLESYPANGALGIEVGYQIRLTFSETLVKPDQGGAMYISPRPSQPPQIKWESDRVTINLAEGFRPDQTYIVSISTAITDLRRNRMDSAVTIAFSTGQTIDSGVVTGSVLTADDKPATGWMVALYNQGTLSEYDWTDSIYPDYLTTVSGAGQFRLQYLPSRAYDLIAFEDKNRDELFNPAAEPFALPDREIAIGGALRLDKLIMVGTVYDSLAPEILSALVTKDQLLRVRLNRKINPAYLSLHCQETTIRSMADSTLPAIRCEGVAESGVDLTDVLTAYFPGLGDGVYQLSLAYQDAAPPLVRDSVIFKSQTDDVAPEISAFQPGDRPVFVDQARMALSFSEPISRDRLSDQTLVLWDEDATVAIEPVWTDPFHLNLVPERLAAGRKYRLDITEFDIRDPGGNALGDSLRSYSFSTLNDDSVGSIAGHVTVALPDRLKETARLTFAEVGSRRQFTLDVSAAPEIGAVTDSLDFTIVVPPGQYLLTGFLDANGDRILTPGSIRPYHLGETKVIFADTIAVRARFETAGIELTFE